VVAAFLAGHAEYAILPVAEVLARRQIALPVATDFLRLWPHRHGTDGFFGAVLLRQG
jgi:16S rRNA (cytosine967-C5)-methyltransferase